MKHNSRLCAVGFVLLLNSSIAISQTDVLTQHTDLARTGWNNQETQLTTANVNTGSFGLLFKQSVDDMPYAQPLLVSGVNIPGKGLKNVLYVCTVNNTVYAFDADDGTAAAYWQRNFNPSGYRPALRTEMHPSLCGGAYHDFTKNIGIVGTPVIDKASNTIYFVTKVVDNTPGVVDNHAWNGDEYSYSSAGFYQYLHAVDLSTGAEKFNGPQLITATAPGTGDGNVGGMVTLDPRRQFNRSGLVLSRGIVYIAFAAHCDWNPYHGWLLGYDAATLQQKLVYTTTPNDGRGGIWMSGAAPAVDENGSLYFTTGNAFNDGTTFNAPPSAPENRGESVIKLTPNAPDNSATAFNLSSYFTPFSYKILNDFDLDFGSQAMLIPNTNMVMTGLKDNNIYVMDRTNLGGFDPNSNNVLQIFGVGSSNAGFHSSFAYFGGTANQYVYQFAENTLLQSYKVNSNSLGTAVSSHISGPTGGSGAYMAVSSNGPDASTAVLWITHAINGCNANQALCSGILRAVRADDINTELWNSSLNPADNMGLFGKMAPPTVANGKVYVNSFSNQVLVYGLTGSNGCSNPNVSAKANNSLAVYSASSTIGGSTPDNAFDNNTSTSWTGKSSGTGGGNSAYLTVDLGAEYTICNINIKWGANYGTDFTIQGSVDGINFTDISTVTGNTSTANTLPMANLNYRYIRMQGVTRSSTASGYSINELEVDGVLTNPCASPSGLSVTNITENTATLNWQPIPDASSYTIQYKTSLVSSWITRTTTSTSIDISALSCNTGYTFVVKATCPSGTSAESTSTFTTSTCSNSCGNLPTRWYSADIGDIGAAGSACYDNTTLTYTIKGSGNDIGGSSDQFQYAFTNVAGDFTIMAQVLTQDAVAPGNKAGIMFRDSVSNTSRYVFLGTTSGGGIVFEYRTSPAGPTTTVTVPGAAAPYWAQLVKSGTTYKAFISPTGAANTWVQVGPTIDAGFGSSATYSGMAVSSSVNNTLSTATFHNYAELAVPLAVKLTSFTATNVDNRLVNIKWTTSSEVNTNYFEVQRSGNGADFVSISQLKSAGSSNMQQSYSTDDYQPLHGLNYYRLKEVDIDGSVSYSQAIKVNFGQNNTPQVFPNPATSFVVITAGTESIKDVSIFDAVGKNIQRIVNNNGQTVITINTTAMPAGVYIVKITTTSQTFERKLLKK